MNRPTDERRRVVRVVHVAGGIRVKRPLPENAGDTDEDQNHARQSETPVQVGRLPLEEGPPRRCIHFQSKPGFSWRNGTRRRRKKEEPREVQTLSANHDVAGMNALQIWVKEHADPIAGQNEAGQPAHQRACISFSTLHEAERRERADDPQWGNPLGSPL